MCKNNFSTLSEPLVMNQIVATCNSIYNAIKIPSVEIPTLDFPTLDFPTLDFPTLNFPTLDFPTLDFPTLDFPTWDFPSSDISSIVPNDFCLFEEINLQDGYVELTENNCASINSLLNSLDVPDSTPTVSKGRMPLADFIKGILIPILAILLPMWQTSYYDQADSIERQKEQEYHEQMLQENREYHEQMLQKVTEFLNSLNEFLEYQESHPCNCSDAPTLQDEESTDTPGDQVHNDSAE